jgi:hypothetical protein
MTGGVRPATARAKLALLVLTSLACGARTPLEDAPAAPRATPPGTASGTAGSAARGGSTGRAGAAGGEDGASPDAGRSPACLTDSDCPGAGACALARCGAGACLNAVAGTSIGKHIPADCHARACDADGRIVDVVDLTNSPPPVDACTMPSCDTTGATVQSPGLAGVPCTMIGTTGRCDGTGRCVQCLTSTDCARGAPCVKHQCAASTCTDGQRDGDETDVDCGGTCAPCANARACGIDQDCLSDDCDALERVCLPASCIDQKRDGDETDVDCGGPACAGCYVGKMCLVDRDCATGTCGPTGLCGGNACADRRQDGTESDVDCGGIDCPPCRVGQMCESSFDCASGHTCDLTSSPPVCR